MAIYNIFNSNFAPVEKIALLLSFVFVFLFAFPVHEYAHARVAYLLGDKTAYYNGRMTINPLAHIDPFGMVLMLLCGFGFAKGVPINPNNFNNRKRGMAISALAGPLSNLLMAFISIFFVALIDKLAIVGFLTNATLYYLLSNLFLFFAISNVSLAIFNLIPIPPLDGSKIIYAILPDRYYYKILSLDRYSFYLFIGLFFLLRVTNLSTENIVAPILNLFIYIWSLVFGL